jgi:prophage regulatory protein
MEQRRLIRRAEVRRRTGLSGPTIWRYETQGTFPQSVRLSENAVAYFEDEIDEWIHSRIRGGGKAVRRSPVAASEKTEAEPTGEAV